MRGSRERRQQRATHGADGRVPCVFRAVVPDLDGAVAKLRSGTVSFWTVPHADIWPGALPSLDFGSDQSDVEVADDGAAGRVQQPARKRKLKAREEDAAEEAKPAMKAKNAAEESRVGRVVAVPAWKFGREWAERNSQRSMSVMIGDITGVNLRRQNGKFVCSMREDKGYKLHLTQSEVDEYTLTGRIAAEAPWKHGEEMKE